MKKNILIIGNTEGLPGVQKDFLNYQEFFMEEKGGNWYESEIISLTNPKKTDLKIKLQSLRNSKLDFLIVIFSGHGGLKRETTLEINGDSEQIVESELKELSSRQITIIDCCRAYSYIQFSESYDRMMKKAYITTSKIREAYEKRIMQAIPQQLTLYACSKGETALDTIEGGLYSKNLLKAARSIQTNFMTVGKAHEIATTSTKQESKDKQNPDSLLLRSLTDQELIFSINPNYYSSY